jgi:hypothetical protein
MFGYSVFSTELYSSSRLTTVANDAVKGVYQWVLLLVNSAYIYFRYKRIRLNLYWLEIQYNLFYSIPSQITRRITIVFGL